MKKQLFLSSALALVTLASCGGNKASWYEPGTPLTVGLICLHDELSTYDANFINAFKDAVTNSGKKVKKSYIVKNVKEDQACADAAKQLVNQGCNIVFSDSFGHDEFMYPTAKEYPNVLFSSATGVLAYNGGVQNYHNAFASIYEGRFLAGVTAGEYLKKEMSSTINNDFYVGYVGAFPFAEVISGYTSWFLGLRYSLNLDGDDLGKNAHMRVKYTGSWYDAGLEKETAEALINESQPGEEDNCILISQHADSVGAPGACAEAGIPNVSYNIDTRNAPGVDKDKIKASYLGHSRIDWTKYYETAIDSTYQGRTIDGEKDRNWTGKLEWENNGLAAKSPVTYECSDDIFGTGPGKVSKQNVEQTAEKLANGEIQVFDTSTFTVTKDNNPGADIELSDGETGTLTSYKVDIGGKKQAVAIDEGGTSYVNESFYRSAPYFDLIIDGIEVEDAE